MRSLGSIATVVSSAMLLVSPAAAQDEALQQQVEELQSRYEQAWVAGDADAVASLFTEDAIFWPVSGGSSEGRDAIRGTVGEEPTPQSAEISSTHTERMGDFVFDVGTFSITLPEAQGGTIEGGYAVVAEETGDGLAIRRLVGFPARRAPQQPQ